MSDDMALIENQELAEDFSATLILDMRNELTLMLQ